MKENDILICGHGSGTPSTKNMHSYLEQRHTQKMSNGMTKELLEVRRFLTKEQAINFSNYYKTLLGRNIYSQDLRQYVYTPHKNGNYYSDCSSSICATYGKCGKNVGLLNTEGMHNKGEKVDVQIVNGHILDTDLSKLQVGDALLFRGNINRAYNGYIGHVEAVYQIPMEGTWDRLSNGKWVYKKPNGNLAKNEWLTINHHWYWFNEKGEAVTGYQVVKGKRYYFETSGDYECALMHTTENGDLVLWQV